MIATRYNWMRLAKHLGLSWTEMRQVKWRDAMAYAKLASKNMGGDALEEAMTGG